MSERQESGKTYVYRAFDARGQLLYVGMTGNLVKRMMNHQSRHWIWDVASLTAETYPTRREARLAEIQAIRTEHPLWNSMHTADREAARDRYWEWERKQFTPEWPSHTNDEWTVLARRLRRLTWPVQYGFILPPLNEAGEIIY